jgi:lipid biosynthesis B12-binding/radical SAM protein
MRLLLVSSNLAETPYAVYPLGMSMVAAALKREGHEVVLFDFLQQGQSLDSIREVVRRVKPELIGISIRNVDNVNLLNEQRYIDAVRHIVQAIRGETTVKIVLGGSGFSVMPEEVLAAVGADYGVTGEGERIFCHFVAEAAGGRYPVERILHATPQLSGLEIPSAHYDADILSYYLKSGNMASVQTKRGCEHGCVYCTYPLLEGRVIRERDPAAVVDDMEVLVRRHQAKYIFFTDSVFNDNRGRYRAVVAEMKRRDLQIPWTAFFKPCRELDDGIVETMRETGLKAAEIGSDAPTDTTLRGIGKDFVFADVDRTNSLFLEHDVATAHYFMFGCPGETQETVLEGIENIKRLKQTAIFVFMGIRILPDTGLARIALRDGVLSEGQSLLEPVYYISPKVDRAWLETTLTAAFSGTRHIVFPPDALEAKLQFLFKLGYSGSLWDMLAKPRAGRRIGKPQPQPDENVAP